MSKHLNCTNDQEYDFVGDDDKDDDDSDDDDINIYTNYLPLLICKKRM